MYLHERYLFQNQYVNFGTKKKKNIIGQNTVLHFVLSTTFAMNVQTENDNSQKQNKNIDIQKKSVSGSVLILLTGFFLYILDSRVLNSIK